MTEDYVFVDLKKIQPLDFSVSNIPETKLSDDLRIKLQDLIQKEENGYYVNISEKTSIVQTGKNYVFLSNQWFYLAVLCKKYAEALYPYCQFVDEKIRPISSNNNSKILYAMNEGDYDIPEITKLFSDSKEKDMLKGFIRGDNKKETFRPGKNFINKDNDKGTINLRETKDVFGSSILGVLPVPNASSNYLGSLVYYLVKNSDVYNLLEYEVSEQMPTTSWNKKELSETARRCAQEIVDCIYEIDKFNRISSLFQINNRDKQVKINLGKAGGRLSEGDALPRMFILPSSGRYNNKDTVFLDKSYSINIGEQGIECHLSAMWYSFDKIPTGKTVNSLRALVEIVNKYYADILEIKNEPSGMYIYYLCNKFEFSKLPDVFRKDLSRRYITSLLAKPFVILTGNSGTGKTRIAKQFAEYLEVVTEEEKKNWLIVPVGSDWTDNVKILGFYNPLADNEEDKYVSTEIVDLIEQANQHEDIPYFLILDEMNLSQVERYFSDFLSHMETPDIPFEMDGYNGTLKYPENLFVVGTVNIDETTYMFSPKVLDRANVVEFKPEQEDVMKLFTEPSSDDVNVIPANNGTAQAFLRMAKEILDGKSIDEEVMKKAEDIFDSVYVVTEKAGFEFAYRTVKEIRQYIAASYELSDGDREVSINDVADEQLLQKVLPKIHGNKKELGDLLNDLKGICDEYNLKLSAEKINQMEEKLAKTQYASFI